MGRFARKLARHAKRVDQESKLLSPFGPPVETTNVFERVPIGATAVWMKASEWLEAESAYRQWLIRCAEDFGGEPEIEEAKRRSSGEIERMPCLHCNFPGPSPEEEEGAPERVELLFHPAWTCTFECIEGQKSLLSVLDEASTARGHYRSLDYQNLGDGKDGSVICPRCSLVRPIRMTKGVEAFVCLVEDLGWSRRTAEEVIEMYEQERRRRTDG